MSTRTRRGTIYSPDAPRPNTLASGFSLVEVLIAVLILAIGLLGLGAVIPVVVREQRLAADATLGVTVANAAKDVITGPLSGNGERLSAWDVWFDHFRGANPVWSRDYEWEPWSGFTRYSESVAIHPASASFSTAALSEQRRGEYRYDPASGALYWEQRLARQPTGPGSGTFIFDLHVRDRLWPSPAIVGTGADRHRPQFVWDIVARRVHSVSQQQIAQNPLMSPHRRLLVEPEIQVAIFVRRIDMNIRVPSGMTLYDVLARTNPGAPAHRLPVAVTESGTDAGMPTLNGVGVYAAPLTLQAQMRAGDNSRRTIDLTGDPVPRRLAGQLGQRLVDNLGNIYTVREVDTQAGGPLWVRIDPPVPANVPAGTDPARPTLRQVVFTPQIPAAVQIVNIKRPVIQP